MSFKAVMLMVSHHHSVAVHGERRVLHHIIHGEILESTEFRTLVPVSEFQENQKRDNGSGHDKHGHQAGQERIH